MIYCMWCMVYGISHIRYDILRGYEILYGKVYMLDGVGNMTYSIQCMVYGM